MLSLQKQTHKAVILIPFFKRVNNSYIQSISLFLTICVSQSKCTSYPQPLPKHHLSLNLNRLSHALLFVPFVHWYSASGRGEHQKCVWSEQRRQTKKTQRKSSWQYHILHMQCADYNGCIFLWCYFSIEFTDISHCCFASIANSADQRLAQIWCCCSTVDL